MQRGFSAVAELPFVKSMFENYHIVLSTVYMWVVCDYLSAWEVNHGGLAESNISLQSEL